jgi:nicotinamide phosphoribosyltransferase
MLKLINIFKGSKFGAEKNSKGYKVLPPCIRVIQGDGISYETLTDILENMKINGWSAENVAFGSGGALLQRLDRDTQKCAYKCSYAVIDGQGVNVYKTPITDMGKKSKKGILTLQLEGDTFVTVEEGKGSEQDDLLIPVYENGELIKEYSFDEVRQRAEISLMKKRNLTAEN